MAKEKDYTTIARNKKFEVDVLDPRGERRDNVRVTLHSDEDVAVHHHLRGYEVARLIRALQDALAFGPEIPD